MIRTTYRSAATVLVSTALLLVTLSVTPSLSAGPQVSIEWVRQPALAERNAVITSLEAEPTALRIEILVTRGNQPLKREPVSLKIKSGSGTVEASLAGTTTVETNRDGYATFAPTINRSGFGYRLIAQTEDASAPSAAFDIVDAARACSGGPCPESTSKGGVRAELENGDVNGYVTLSIGLEGGNCNDAKNRFYQTTVDAVTFNVQGSTKRTVVTIILDASVVDRSHPLYEVCFSSPESTFHNKWGESIRKGEDGILHTCRGASEEWAGEPCLVSKESRPNGDIAVTFSVPPGDPRGVL